MNPLIVALTILTITALSSCGDKPAASNSGTPQKGSFSYDLRFLQQYDSVVVLKHGDAAIAISPKYQGKVFTSTATGDTGTSFGWINYKAFTGTPDPHMNAYGGENRLWLGPEGGPFSLFFKPGDSMVFANWKTPAAYDNEPWNVDSKSGTAVRMHKDMNLINFKGTALQLKLDRTVTMMDEAAINAAIGTAIPASVKAVAYHTDNAITNTGNKPWTEQTGMPCIWVLDMLQTTPATVIVVPFNNPASAPTDSIATTNYFGQIPPDRLKWENDKLYLKADGQQRGKLGIQPKFAGSTIGSYDPVTKVLTVALYHVDKDQRYLNQEWTTTKPPFSGDAVNAYNDGPLKDGTQMGPFYEIETVSPAAFLPPGATLNHQHTVLHMTGDEAALEPIALKLLGVSLTNIKKHFEQFQSEQYPEQHVSAPNTARVQPMIDYIIN